ncbi:MAG TPA: PQQ-binding-like beta-propeller repeat protein [Pyrinomonadaceae bacterium]|nr:PQQ-binding-like beta-propeller repeat protein [Pyrinomonadaceae bacterium]
MPRSTHGSLRRTAQKRLLLLLAAVALLLCGGARRASAAQQWAAKFDGRVRFYQATELGVVVVGTEKSLYGVDGETGDVLWRLKNARLNETDVAPVPGTDVLLLTFERGDKTRLEAADLLTGDALWRSDKVRGSLMQTAFDPEAHLLAAVLVHGAHGTARDGFKKKPVVHLFDLAAGEELWHRELESEVEMMPALGGGEGEGDEVDYTLDNYRPPAFLDGRLYLFYEGVTSLDAQTGGERRREKFHVNEDGLALTDAEPLADERNVYISGRGHVRAVAREDGDTVWESKDLGVTPEMILAGGVIYVRTGGEFTRLADGEPRARGPFGVSAVEASSGKVIWRYKGADKGITNIALPDASTVVVADHDDLIFLDAATGKRRLKVSHHVERAAFVLVNEGGEVVVGGTNELAAFNSTGGSELWRERHDPPGRGVLRTVAAVAARAASLYFRYGGTASTVFRSAQLLGTLNSLRWSGLAAHATLPGLTTLAENRARDYARDYVRQQFSTFGILSRARLASAPRLPSVPRPSVQNVPRPSVDVEDRLLDRLDPASQLDRLSRFLLRRRRLAALQGQWMYFYTELRGGGGRGLVGVNVNTGEAARSVRLNEPDARFISDEVSGLLYTAKDERLLAYTLKGRE